MAVGASRHHELGPRRSQRTLSPSLPRPCLDWQRFVPAKNWLQSPAEDDEVHGDFMKDFLGEEAEGENPFSMDDDEVSVPE